VQSVDFSRIRLFHGKKLKSSFVFIKWIDYIFTNFSYSSVVSVTGISDITIVSRRIFCNGGKAFPYEYS
jgi:hypothetical protein